MVFEPQRFDRAPLFLSAFSPPTHDQGRPCPATVPQSCHYPAVSLSSGSPLPYSFYPAYAPSATTHRSSRTLSGACASPFPFCLFVVAIGCYPRFHCLLVRFQSPRSLRIGCASIFVRVISPVGRVSSKTPKNLRLHRRLALFCPRLSPLPFLSLPNPRLPPNPFFPFVRASAPAFPFPLFLVVSAISLTGLPNQGSAWFPPFLRWFQTASMRSSRRTYEKSLNSRITRIWYACAFTFRWILVIFHDFVDVLE